MSKKTLPLRRRDTSRHDKILKENLQPVLETLLRMLLDAPILSLEFLPVTKQQTTLEREPDFICVMKNVQFPSGVLLHIEFESQAKPELADRMLEYVAIERRRHKMDVLPIVVFLGAGKPNLQSVVQQEGLDFRFKIHFLNEHPFEELVHSQTPEEVVLAILTNFGSRTAEEAIRLIINQLKSLRQHAHLLNKFLIQLRTLSKLRNLQPQTQKLIKEMTVTDIFSLEDDVAFLEGKIEGKIEGLSEGILEGQDLKDHVVAFNMLDLGHPHALIADVLEISDEKVAAIEQLWHIDKQMKLLKNQGMHSIPKLSKALGIPSEKIKKLQLVAAERKKR